MGILNVLWAPGGKGAPPAGAPALYDRASCLWTWLQQSPKEGIQRLPVFLPFMTLAAELGECELPEHTPELVSQFRFIPNQTEAMEFDIFQRWKECRYLDATL